MKKALSLILLALTACTQATGPLYSQQSYKEPVIVLYWPDTASNRSNLNIEINGKQVCELKPHGYYLIKYSPEINISSPVFMGTSVSKFSFSPEKDKYYYVRMELNSSRRWAEALSGVMGAVISDEYSSHKGHFIFTLVDKKEAEKELMNLHQDCM